MRTSFARGFALPGPEISVLVSAASHNGRLVRARHSQRRSIATIITMSTKVTINNNGPIRLEGEFEICDAQGNKYGLAGRTVISLCRCGKSGNKPFCDGTHRRGGFESVCEARELPAPKRPGV